MTRKVSKLALVGGLLVLLVLATTVASASPNVVTYDSITASCGFDSPLPDSDVAVAITAQNVGGDGAAGYEIELEFDHTQLTLDAVTAGADMTALGCSFNTQIGFETPPYSWVTGSCTTAVNPGATGANIELVVAHFSFTGVAGPYTVTLVTDGLGVPTALLDPAGTAANATAGQLSSCTPTAVDVTSFDASGVASSALALWPLLAGGAAVAAGAGYALMRRKR